MLLRLLLDATTPDFPASWLLNPGGITVTGVILFLALSFWKGWIVPGWLFQQMKAERDAYKDSQDKYLEESRARDAAERRELRANRTRTPGDS